MAFAGARIGKLLEGLRGRPSLQAAAHVLRPEGIGGWAMELAPDVLGAAALANSMQGATGQERGLAGATDLAEGVGLSFLSRGLGGFAGHRMARMRGIKNADELMSAAHGGAMIGGMVGPMGAYATIGTERMNPFYASYANRMAEENEEQMRQQILNEGPIRTMASNLADSPRLLGLDALLGGGGYG